MKEVVFSKHQGRARRYTGWMQELFVVYNIGSPKEHRLKHHISCILIARVPRLFHGNAFHGKIFDEIVTTKLVIRGSVRALLGLCNTLSIVYFCVIVSSTTEERYAWCIPQTHLAMTAFLTTLTVVKELSTELRGSTRQKDVGYSAIATLLCYVFIAQSLTTLILNAR